MMNAKEVIRKALFETYTIDELKKEPKTIMLQDIDENYWEFVVKQEFVDHGEVFYWIASLFVVARKTYPEVIPLINISNIGYKPDEAIEEMAKVIMRLMND